MKLEIVTNCFRMTDVKAATLVALASSTTILQSIEADINDLHDELALGQRIVTAAEHDRNIYSAYIFID